MEPVRCGRCRALLFRAESLGGVIEIKCRRCGTINHLRPSEPAQSAASVEETTHALRNQIIRTRDPRSR